MPLSHFRERATISIYYISTLSVVETTEPQRTSSFPATVADAPKGPYVTRWACCSCTNLVWDPTKLANGRAELDTVVYLPQRSRNGEHLLLNGICNGFFQVPETHFWDRFAVKTSAEPLYVKNAKRSLRPAL